MRNSVLIFILALLSGAAPTAGQEKVHRLDVQHADQWEVILSKFQDTTFYVGSVVFQTENGQIYCDSAIWLKGKKLKLKGRVILDDEEYHLAADSIDYDLVTNEALALGDYVELWSHRDSLFAVGTYAYYDRTNKTFAMRRRPTVFLKYPDSTRMIKVVADSVHYEAGSHVAEAIGKAEITSKDLHATAGIARLNTENSRLELEDAPVANRKQSRINGREIVVLTSGDYLSRIEVHDSARGEFIEPAGTDSVHVDRSILTGKDIIFDFDSGQLHTVTSSGQAYSWYLPSDHGKTESNENTVSGDTIVFQIAEEKLHTVVVQGGAIGSFRSTTSEKKDTTVVTKRDTVDYKAQTINYSLRDSLITLLRQSEVTSGDMILNAHRVTFDTKRRVVQAFSAEPPIDSVKSTSTFAAALQPNAIPVVLKDKGDVMYGDYLIYAIDTHKGRILKSKSKYETGFFYGNDLYRQQKGVYYLDDGRYTTCDAAEPHFHFYSKHLKLIENDRLVAKPVVLSIGRLPILAVPYYVFPLKKGRHSGILPFTLGNVERGERYIRNVGYYWAASDYWDVQSSLDYYDQSNTINFYGKTTYAKRYVFSGGLSGNYTRQTIAATSLTQGLETKRIRWTLAGSHTHTFSPSFQLAANGNYQSDNTFYKDYSTDMNERLNRLVRSQITFSKRFGKSYSISGSITHDKNLDQNTRTDQIPSLTFSQVRVYPFGSGRVDPDGTIHRHFYNNLVTSYTPSVLGYSARYPVIDSIVGTDTLRSNRHRDYAKATHSVGVNMPLTVAKYFVLTPSASYNEVWYRVFRTELSDSAGIDPNTFYRAFAYSTGASLSTHLYGTMAPHLLGVNAFRQVIQPSVSYAYTPAINKNPTIRDFAGGGPGNASKTQSMSVTLQHVYQAKVQHNSDEKTLDLLSVSHSFSYNFEAKNQKYSDLTTTFSSTLLPKVNFSGGMTHSLYRPGTNELRWRAPALMAFNMSATVALAGKNFLFDDPNAPEIKGADSASQLNTGESSSHAANSSGWSLRTSYTYSESGRGSGFSKSSFLQASLDFSLTPSTKVVFNQSYDLGKGRTVYSSVSLSRQLHCWSGEFFWVPTGSTRGYGFRLYVTAIPAIKIDNSQSAVPSSYLQNLAR